MESTFSVIFRGEVLDGREPAQVRASLAELFSLPAERIDRLFGGRPVVLKRGLKRGEAVKFRSALAKAGAVAMLREEADTATPQATAPATPQATPKTESAQPAPVATSTSETLSCPRCGHEQAVADACVQCKMDLRLHRQRLAKRERVLALRRGQ